MLPLKQDGPFRILVHRCQAGFFGHQSGKVNRETVGIVKSPNVLTVEFGLASLLCGFSVLFKEFFTTIKSSRERLLFFVEDFENGVGVLGELGEHILGLINQGGSKTGEK